MRNRSCAERGKRIRLWLRIARCAAVFLVVGALALFEYLCPMRSLLPAPRVAAREEGELRLHFFDTDGGECTAVEFPEGDVLVIDGGKGGFGTRVPNYIKALNPARVSVVLTNPGYGHTGGLAELISALSPEELYLPAFEAETGAYRRAIAAAERAGCETKRLTRYGVIARDSGAYAVCLSPYSMGETDADEASSVLYLQYGEFRALLCSDTTASREEKLMNEYAIDETIFDRGNCTVRLPQLSLLRTARGGAAGASSEKWLFFLGAETGIVSCGWGEGSFSGEVAKRLHSAGTDVYRTDELGTVVVSVRNGEYRVFTQETE